jgi:hypothetical protein
VGRLDQDRRQPGLDQPRVQPLRQWTGLQPDAREPQVAPFKERDQGLALALHLGFADDLSGRIDHAHAAPFQRDIDRGIVLHGCPSMLMLGADLRTRSTITVSGSRL